MKMTNEQISAELIRFDITNDPQEKKLINDKLFRHGVTQERIELIRNAVHCWVITEDDEPYDDFTGTEKDFMQYFKENYSQGDFDYFKQW